MRESVVVLPPDRRSAASRAAALVIALAAAALLLPVGTSGARVADPSAVVPVLVTARDGSLAALERSIEAVGGVIDMELGIINGVRALVPAGALDDVRAIAGVRWVSPDRRVSPMEMTSDGTPGMDTLRDVARAIGADDLWTQGITGQGVDVAVIDSGVVPVEGFLEPGAVVNGPDLSFESQSDELRYLDSYGHGTHIASIIAGHDGAGGFRGIAPGARLLNVKVASASGATDVSQVIAAIDWVVQHRNDAGLNVRVLNLSFGTDSQQPYTIDPLAFAAEIAWRNGIVVVAAAGNAGDAGPLADPAYDPNILAVGAADTHDTPDRSDDSIPDWSSRGTDERRPDVVAPGVGIVGLRDPGSTLDAAHPLARIGERFFRGNGTSQAAAVVSGAAALLLQANPSMGPRAVKAALVGTATSTTNPDGSPGPGMIDVAAANAAGPPASGYGGTWTPYGRSDGDGSLEAARGSVHVAKDGITLSGERDILGSRFEAEKWAGDAEDLDSWDRGKWNGMNWSGSSMSAPTWAGMGWSGMGWSGMGWSGMGWSGMGWSGLTWGGIEPPPDIGLRGMGWSSSWWGNQSGVGAAPAG